MGMERLGRGAGGWGDGVRGDEGAMETGVGVRELGELGKWGSGELGKWGVGGDEMVGVEGAEGAGGEGEMEVGVG